MSTDELPALRRILPPFSRSSSPRRVATLEICKYYVCKEDQDYEPIEMAVLCTG
jgi:hypothetical protein